MKIFTIITFIFFIHSCNSQSEKSNELSARDYYDVKFKNPELIDIIFKDLLGEELELKNLCEGRILLEFTLDQKNELISINFKEETDFPITENIKNILINRMSKEIKIDIGQNGKDYYNTINKNPTIFYLIQGKRLCN